MAAAVPIYTLTYNNLNGPPLPDYTPGTNIVIPANLRQAFDATAIDEIGGVISFFKDPDPANNTLVANGTFIISGVGGSVNWMPVVSSFLHNSYMIFHTHPPRIGAHRYNVYSSADLSLFLKYLLSIRRNPGISIHFALFTPTDIHFTFVDEVCFKLLKLFIKSIRDEIFPNPLNPLNPLLQTLGYNHASLRLVFPDHREFTRYIEIFLLLILEQIISYLFTQSNRAGYTDAAALIALDKISLMPIPNSPSHQIYTAALATLQQCIANKNFQGLQIGDQYLINVISTDQYSAHKIAIIGTLFFNMQMHANMINIAIPGRVLTQQEQMQMFDNLGLFKSTTLNRVGIPARANILIRCHDNSKIYNETIGWPIGPPPNVIVPNINSPIVLQDGGFQKGGAITTGAIVKINNDNKISMIAPIGSTTLKSKSKLLKMPSIRRHTTKSHLRHTTRHTTRHTARHK